MIFTETKLKGAFIIELKRREDERGFFARTLCQREFSEHGLEFSVAQASIASNRRKGTLRGMHFQFPPAAEAKLIRCTRGAIVDVIVDLRPESSTYLQHIAVELDAGTMRALYVPERFAHGYQVLEDDTDVSYEMNAYYAPSAEGGLLHDDPRLELSWPLAVTAISTKDCSYRPLNEIESELKRKMCVTPATFDGAEQLMQCE